MLKYDEIIKKLSDSEKIHILCDIRNLSDKSYREKGIPRLREESAESLGAGEFPPPDALADTWDIPLVCEVADALAAMAVKKNTDLFSVPAPRARISPFRRALSEDPLLASSISREYLKAASRAHMSARVGGFGLHGDELAFLDGEPDGRFTEEFLAEPYRRALADTKCAVVNVFRDPDGGPYGAVHTALADLIRGKNGFGGALPVCGRVSPEGSVSCIAQGQLFFEGSPSAVQAALSRYKKLSEAVKRGEASESALEAALAEGHALSPEMLDGAMDRLLDFVFSVKRRHVLPNVSAHSATALRAVEESLVLLKNESALLPLSAGGRVCLIGDIAFEGADGERCVDVCAEGLQTLGHEIVGTARGYRLNQTRNEDMIGDAAALAAHADAVVVFLGIGEQRAKKARLTKKISLPANQKALLDGLGKYRDKIVAVLPSDELWDADFSPYCAAIVTMPLKTVFSGKVLADALAGRLNPCGKLVRTVYSQTENYDRDRLRSGVGTGIFLGYRYYDTAGTDVGFPFGHGLGYTEFAYTDLASADPSGVSVTVKNVGKRKGTEIVQVYARKLDSAVVRPEKELAGFARVELNPGEWKTVRIPLRLPEVCSPAHGRCVTEAGDYAIFVGASVSDIRLLCEITADGETLAPDGKQLCDYIHTKSNIQTHNYKLEAKVTKMKRSVCNLIAGCAAIVLAIVLKMYCTAMGAEPRFFAWFELLLCLLGLWIFITEARHRRELNRKERELLDRANDALFADAEQLPEYDATTMFAHEFDRAEALPTEEAELPAQIGDTEYFASVDRKRGFAEIVSDFEAFARERGCQFRRDSARRIFSALVSSRLIVFKDLEQQDFRTLMRLLSEYFDTAPCVDRVDGSYTDGASLLYRAGDQVSVIGTEALMAIEAAKNAPAGIHLVGLSDVRCESAENWFAPYLPYIGNPAGNVSVRITNELQAESLQYIPANVWFVMNLAQGESPDRMPSALAYAAAVDAPCFDACREAEARTELKHLGYYQLEYLQESMESVCAPDESLWKKIDLLEESVSRAASFRIDNKLWLGMERFAYAYTACGGDPREAVDEAAAARLIVPILVACKAYSADTDVEEMLERVFGNDGGEACKRVVRNRG